ncbi:MAG: low molecular weight phosphotyrosine protein phosphatase [Candidatus Thiodiazotropha sp.]
MFKSILTVCTANICRSPMAEYLLRHVLTQSGAWHGVVFSAGVSALVNQPADSNIIDLMLDRGITLDMHRAKQLTKQHLRQSDLVLVMEEHHKKSILNLDPTARGKTFLLGYWCNMEILDPFRRGNSAYQNAIRSIEGCLNPWVDKIVNS